MNPGPDQPERAFERIIGNSVALESVLDQVEQVAPTDSTVLYSSFMARAGPIAQIIRLFTVQFRSDVDE